MCLASFLVGDKLGPARIKMEDEKKRKSKSSEE